MTTPLPHPRGGLYFEDFAVGQLFRHRLTRTVTQMDNMLFSNMTSNPQPLHIDAHFCATETEWGRPLMNSLFTLGLMIGISVNDTTVGTTIANLGMTDVAFPAPLFEGDTVRAETEVLSTRASKSRPDAGLVEFRHRAFKQDGDAGRRMPAHRLHASARARDRLGLSPCARSSSRRATTRRGLRRRSKRRARRRRDRSRPRAERREPARAHAARLLARRRAIDGRR